jgi:hypothetical protein
MQSDNDNKGDTEMDFNISEIKDGVHDIPSDILLDENGDPYLPVENQKVSNNKKPATIDHEAIKLASQLGLVTEETIVEKIQPKTNSALPVIALVDSAKKSDTTINTTISLKLIDKNLFNVLSDSFEGSKEQIIDHLINSISIEELKEKLKIELNKHYNQTL